MDSDWKSVSVKSSIYDELQRRWKSDTEAQKRSQRFTPWLNMILAEDLASIREEQQETKQE